MPTSIGNQAIVIGAGISGLSAARVLADHFEHVVVLERDLLPVNADHRNGTPQGRHVHALMRGGLYALNDLFPGFEQDLVEGGAISLQAGLDIRVERPGYDPFPQRDLGWCEYAASRPLVEFIVRRCVEQHPNITVRSHCRVRDVETTSDGAAVVGVRYNDADDRTETLPADFVVDASAHGALTLALMKAIGRPLPEETAIGVDIGYATTIFAIPNDATLEWRAVMTLPQAPESSRGALLLPVEGERWMLSVSGSHGDWPPAEWDGFLKFAQQLRTPTIYNAIKDAKRLTEIARFRFTASVRRHFERLESFPLGFLPLGDVICRFNPVYGQGMTVALQEACLLRRLLSVQAVEGEPLAGLASIFFAQAQKLIETPWTVATLDFVFPQTRGERPPNFEFTLKFGAALIQLAARDPAVHKLITEVQNLLKPGSVYGDPQFMRRVLALMAAM